MRWLGIAVLPALLGFAHAQDEPEDGNALIDRHIEAAWKVHGVRPAPEATDAEFLRRLSLDLRGVIPEAEEVRLFLASDDPEKRWKKIEQYVGSPRFLRHWAEVWATLLVGIESGEEFDRDALVEWLRARLDEEQPLDRVARRLVAASGAAGENPAVNFPLRYLEEGPESLATRVSKVFMGVRLNCAQCHDHPFDSYTRTDFFEWSAFFWRTQPEIRERVGESSYRAVRDRPTREPYVPEGFRLPVRPQFLDGIRPVTAMWRDELALYITRNPQFARAIVNRVWAQLLGRGIVDPPDNFSSKNPPSMPGLLDALAGAFRVKRYDLRWLVRSIVLSRPYALSSRNADLDPDHARLFDHVRVRPMMPRPLFDSLARATGLERTYSPDKLDILRRSFLDRFSNSIDGDAPNPFLYRESIQEIMDKLAMDDFRRAARRGGLLPRDGEPDLDSIFLHVLSRPPTGEERALFGKHREENDAPWKDLFYALINSSRFFFNH